MSETILYSVDSAIATLTLNRPARLNAFNEEMAKAWAELTGDATACDDVKAIIIDAAGPAFCAGGDVLAMASAIDSAEAVTDFAHLIHRGMSNLLTSAVPVVMAVHGVVAGGGLGVVLCGDYAVMADSASIGSRYANMGLTPDLSVSALLGRAVGERRALELVLRDRMLTADEAVEWGLVAEAVPAADVAARAREIATEWVSLPSGAYGQAKRLVRSAPHRSLQESLDDEARTIGRAYNSPEASERIRAFAAKARTS